ncbi:aspartate aminotransferase family protein [Tsukamurella sputi]|uniref:Aspartate aminotransferase family protein n=1 Tax=Tsukamurella sputi TaxID=2591848 RepID=A0A5C5RRA5_9ACTN|nr:aspartate aminotransferase family protein [Tsukamurella sputi]TWS25048.1 aspartate aminotransferase family protein [Tsukamurella sputi]
MADTTSAPTTSPLDVNRFTAADAAGLPDDVRHLVARRDAVLGDRTPLLYRRPIHPVSAKGLWLTDADGTRFLDMYNNVASVGHCHPAVVEAVATQAATLNTHTRYLHEGAIDYGQRLLRTMPGFGQISFTCTGSEANDLAVRLARHATGSRGVIVTRGAYHGGTAVSASCSPSVDPDVPDWVRVVDAPDPYRTGDSTAAGFTAAVSEAAADLQRTGTGVAALLLDTVFSSDGVQPDPVGVLTEAVAAVRAAGGLFIADEVQPGFGRMGHGMWGYEHHGVTPDIVTMGKPMAAGLPVAATVLATDLSETLTNAVPYFNTFGGNPVSMAAAAAVLDVIEREGLIDAAATRGEQLRGLVREIQQDSRIIGDVRGRGLFVGIEIVTDRGTKVPDRTRAVELVDGLRERGVLISTAGHHGNVLKVRPPLPITSDEIEFFATRFADTLGGA